MSTITLNRPPANAINLGIREELNQAIIELEQNKDTTVEGVQALADPGPAAPVEHLVRHAAERGVRAPHPELPGDASEPGAENEHLQRRTAALQRVS